MLETSRRKLPRSVAWLVAVVVAGFVIASIMLHKGRRQDVVPSPAASTSTSPTTTPTISAPEAAQVLLRSADQRGDVRPTSPRGDDFPLSGIPMGAASFGRQLTADRGSGGRNWWSTKPERYGSAVAAVAATTVGERRTRRKDLAAVGFPRCQPELVHCRISLRRFVSWRKGHGLPRLVRIGRTVEMAFCSPTDQPPLSSRRLSCVAGRTLRR